MWSCGCIMGELIIGKPLLSGNSTINQLDQVLKVTGLPSSKDINSIQSPFAKQMIDNIKLKSERVIDKRIDNTTDLAVDIMINFLRFNPKKRITAEMALVHPYIAQFHDI